MLCYLVFYAEYWSVTISNIGSDHIGKIKSIEFYNSPYLLLHIRSASEEFCFDSDPRNLLDYLSLIENCLNPKVLLRLSKIK